ncbi:MAG: hypothetical protein R2828_06545 [Saprospiraceae bacterium]
MSTKYLDFKENDNFIFLDPISPVSNNTEEISEESSTSKESYSYTVLIDLFQTSIEQKLKSQRTRPKFQVLQKWEGVVEQFDGDIIQVKLTDLTNGGTDEEAELEIQDISKDDQPLVKEGAMFYWSIGYETQLDRQVKKASFIKFKRLPRIDLIEFDSIHDRAKELENQILLD